MRPDPYAWSLHLDATLPLVAVAAAYALALRRYPTPRWRIACFAAGAALLLATAVTPLHGLQFHLLSAHLLQNVVLAEWAPLLLVLGVPPALAALTRRSAIARTVTHPAFALPVWLATYFAWHFPAAYEAALEHPSTLLHLEHVSYVFAGVLLWWPVVADEPHRLSGGARAVYLFAAFVLASPLGLLLALLPDPVYGYYEAAGGLWGLSPLADQQLAGVTMAAEQGIVFSAGFGLFLARFLRDDEGAALAAEESPAP